MTDNTPVSRSGWTTAALCFMVALLEGFDLQSVGMAAAGIGAEFKLAPTQLGWIFSAGLLGLLPGAFCGGMLADRFGRKRVLLGAVLLFGLASLATAAAWDLASLGLSRFLTGLGIGAALPMIIALAAEAAGAGNRSLAVSVTFCGVPLGGASAALVGLVGPGLEWRFVFHLGGYAPVAVAVLLAWLMPESRLFVEQVQRKATLAQDTGAGLSGLFAQGLWRQTFLLWASSFFTLTVLYMLMNWLPSLLLGHSFARPAVAQVQVLFNLGGAFGAVLTGRLMDRSRWRQAVIYTYGGMVAGLAGLGLASGLLPVLVAGSIAGYGLMGGQSILYALAPALYPTRVRATGVGVSVAVGRLGSVSGPLLAGKLLASGVAMGGIVAAAVPGILVAATCAFTLLARAMPRPCRGMASDTDKTITTGDPTHEASRIP